MTASLRLLRALETRLPVLARALATPPVRGAAATDTESGVVWRAPSATPRALVVYLTEAPALSRWLAGSIALRLGALVLVPAATTDATALRVAIAAAREHAVRAGELPDGCPVAIVAEADAAPTAMAVSAGTASRLALLYPSPVAANAAAPDPIAPDPVAPSPVAASARIPTTLIQAAASGPSRTAVIALEKSLRAAGTAVRETEYDAVVDGWARYPKVSTGSGRALDDLVAFLDRGIGEASTFDVIPGWDLH